MLNFTSPTARIGLALLSTLIFAGCSKSARIEKYVHRGAAYFAAGDYQRSELEYLNALRLDPRDPHAVKRLGLIYAGQGRTGRAVPFLLAARKLDPADAELQVCVARLRLSIGDHVAARSEAAALLEREPTHDSAPVILAEAAVTSREVAEATALLERLVAGRETSGLRVSLGLLAVRRNDLEVAEREFKRAIELTPASDLAHLALGNLRKLQGRRDEAASLLRRASALGAPRSASSLAHARFQFEQHALDAARVELESIVARYPDYLDAWSMLAEIAATQHRPEDAIKIVGRILQQEPGHPGSLVLGGQLQLSKGDRETAVAAMRKLVKAYGSSALAHQQLAVALLAADRSIEAIAELEQAVALAPGSPRSVLLLANVNIGAGRLEPAIASLRELTGRRPDLADARLLLANALRMNGRIDEALQVYDSLQSDLPSNPQPSWFGGLVHLQQRDLPAARAAFERVVAIAPDNLPATEQLVNLDLAAGRSAEASARVAAFRSRYPDVADILVVEAKVRAATGEMAGAENALLAHLRARPASRTSRTLLARLYSGQGRSPQAVPLLQWIVEHTPDDVESWMMLGAASLATGDSTGAIRAYARVVELDPKATPALNNLACLTADAGDLERALGLAKRARDLAPMAPDIADTLGWILIRQGEIDWATSLLREAAKGLPRNPDVLHHLGVALYAAGDSAQARATLSEALELGAARGAAEDIRNRIAVLEVADAGSGAASARAVVEARLQQSPRDAIAWVALASLEAANGKHESAVSALQKALEIHPKNFRALASLARLYSLEPARAREGYTLAKTAARLAPADPHALQIAGQLAALLGEHRPATTYLQQASRLAPADAGVACELAEAYVSLGRIAEAESAMARALALGLPGPRTSSAQRFVALCAAARATAPDGIDTRILDEMRTQNAAHPLVLLVAARQRALAGDGAAGAKAYEDLLAAYPDNLLAQSRLAALYAEDDSHLERAYELAQKARQMEPANPESTRTLAVVVFRRRDFAYAETLFRDTLRANPGDAAAHFYLGMTAARLNKGGDANAALRVALKLGLPEKQRIAAEEALHQLAL